MNIYWQQVFEVEHVSSVCKSAVRSTSPPSNDARRQLICGVRSSRLPQTTEGTGKLMATTCMQKHFEVYHKVQLHGSPPYTWGSCEVAERKTKKYDASLWGCALWQRNVEIESLSYKLHNNSVFLNYVLLMHSRRLHKLTPSVRSEVVKT